MSSFYFTVGVSLQNRPDLAIRNLGGVFAMRCLKQALPCLYKSYRLLGLTIGNANLVSTFVNYYQLHSVQIMLNNYCIITSDNVTSILNTSHRHAPVNLFV